MTTSRRLPSLPQAGGVISPRPGWMLPKGLGRAVPAQVARRGRARPSRRLESALNGQVGRGSARPFAYADALSASRGWTLTKTVTRSRPLPIEDHNVR